MVTIASFLYLAYTFCDDEIVPTTCPAEDSSCHSFQTSPAFRKLFCKAGPYFIELETKADTHYDAAGIGRLHRRGAPSALCLSVPVSKRPNYGTVEENETPLSICCGKKLGDGWQFGFDEGASFTVLQHSASDNAVIAQLQCTLPSGDSINQQLTLSEGGLELRIKGQGTVGLMLPAFAFDGQEHTHICMEEGKLCIRHKHWQCTYATSSKLTDLALQATNRNGIYKAFVAEGLDELCVHISIDPIP